MLGEARVCTVGVVAGGEDQRLRDDSRWRRATGSCVYEVEHSASRQSFRTDGSAPREQPSSAPPVVD